MHDVDTAGHSDPEALVRRRLAERIGDEVAYGIGVDEPFLAVGVDSLDLMHVVAQLEQDADVKQVAEAELWAVASSIASLVAYISLESDGGGDGASVGAGEDAQPVRPGPGGHA
ncbi:acyl carrier protein [Planotetraspora sp. A-T 1434]|uniref:acyl carrier protein n=1 Tax=Planotetraspora sp. A-T 1434 TaxID=2979219 RepID=UPI0021BFD204|nr:acyl carrier protein [Planotetraspora sp. A-T 1434]MCT9935256.1 acyl carrier protein [Planotetraspora sp. A-T 1434]